MGQKGADQKSDSQVATPSWTPTPMLDGAPLPTNASIRDFRGRKADYVADAVEQALLLPEDMADLRFLRRHKVFLSPLLLIPFHSGRNSQKISYQSLHQHKALPCSTSGWIPVDSGPFRSISVSFDRYTNSSRYWNQTRSTHLVTAPVTWRNVSHHSSLLFLLLQFFCAFHALQLFSF